MHDRDENECMLSPDDIDACRDGYPNKTLPDLAGDVAQARGGVGEEQGGGPVGAADFAQHVKVLGCGEAGRVGKAVGIQ
jgi:hypothetical protein